MKVFIFDSTTLDKAPYIKNYTQIFDESEIEYDICTWDKYSGNGVVSKKSGLITVHKKWHLGKRKLLDFVSVSRILKDIIQKGQYTHLIIVNSIWELLLCDVLHKFKNKYIIDIRDYKCENVIGVKWFLKKLISDSFFTTISSGGFRNFLPQSEKIIENHNISNWDYEGKEVTLNKNKALINIVYMGHVRYFEENKKLINSIKGSKYFTLTYIGTYAVGCDLKNNESSNIKFFDRFENNEKPSLYKDYDLIHSLYGNKDISITSLLPNRLYDAVLFKKPILASEGTYLAKLVEKYGLGVVLDLYADSFTHDLVSYIKNFDEKDFYDKCTYFLEMVRLQQNKFLYEIKLFCEES